MSERQSPTMERPNTEIDTDSREKASLLRKGIELLRLRKAEKAAAESLSGLVGGIDEWDSERMYPATHDMERRISRTIEDSETGTATKVTLVRSEMGALHYPDSPDSFYTQVHLESVDSQGATATEAYGINFDGKKIQKFVPKAHGSEGSPWEAVVLTKEELPSVIEQVKAAITTPKPEN